MFKSISNWKQNKLFREEKIEVDCLKKGQIQYVKNNLNQRFKSKRHNVFTEVFNKIVLSSS